MGATYPEQIALARQEAPGLPILIPGVGAQGGDLAASVAAGQTLNGDGIVVNASRSVIYASGGVDFADAALAEVLRMNRIINENRV